MLKAKVPGEVAPAIVVPETKLGGDEEGDAAPENIDGNNLLDALDGGGVKNPLLEIPEGE